MIEWVAAAADFLTSIGQKLGSECPKCGKNSWMTQQNLGHTFHGRNFRVRCGSCGATYKVPYVSEAAAADADASTDQIGGDRG